jgi:hypothetical protein
VAKGVYSVATQSSLLAKSFERFILSRTLPLQPSPWLPQVEQKNGRFADGLCGLRWNWIAIRLKTNGI